MPARTRLFIAVRLAGLTFALLIAGFAFPAACEPLTLEARDRIEQRLFGARLLSNAKAALEVCREVEAAAARYDPDPFYDAMIASCTAYAEKHLRNKEAACKAQMRALELLQSVRSDHPKYAEAAGKIAALRRDQAWFGC